MTNATPLISVIVPVHDLAGHVAACINSLRGQSHADFEALVIDDGSTDASAARATEAMAGDPRFRLIAQDHAGLSAARNTGLDAARGCFIAFVDGDDRVMPDFLARLLWVLQATGGDWVACALRYCFPDGSGATHSAIHTAPALDAHPALCRHALATWPEAVAHFPSAWNKLYRRALIGDLRFDEGTWFEDHAFFLRVAARTDHLWHLAEPLYLQTRGRVGQITGRDDDRVFQTFDVLDRLRDILADSPRPGGDAALATLIQRLIGERAEVLATPERRARFAQHSAAYLGDAVEDSPDPCWREEMRGRPPISVVLAWDGADAKALSASLGALTGGAVRGQEVLIVCPDRDAANRADTLRPTDAMRVLVQAGQGAAAREATGLDAARGACVIFARAGDRPDTDRFHQWTVRLLDEEADLGLVGETADTDALADPRPLAAHLFHRDLLTGHDLRLDPADRDGRAFCLGAALAARRVIALSGPAIPTLPVPALPARTLLAEHDARIKSLPAPLAARLPEGWQRRLFLRALWQNWCAAQHWPRPRRRVMVLAALAGALRRGYRAAASPPAGLDPDIPPRIARVLGPPAPVLPDPALRADLTPFPLTGDGLLRLRTDLAVAPYANLSFLSEDRVAIRLHLSLRRDEGWLVLNTRDAAGAWAAERLHPVSLGARTHVVAIRFTETGVTVTLDGAEVLRAPPPEGTIAFLECEGPIALSDVVPSLPRSDEITLDPRLVLHVEGGKGPLRTEHDNTPLALLPDPAGPGAVRAPLPGWVWADLPADAALVIARDGATPLRLTRRAMRDRLDSALCHRIDAADTAFALGLLEHLIDGDFTAALSPAARDTARALARRFGLAGQLPSAPPPSPLPIPPEVREIRAALARFTQAMIATPAPDPLDVLRGLDVPGAARRGLCLALSPVFAEARHDGPAFEGFAAMACDTGVTGGPLPADAWTRAALLPLLLAEGRGDEVREVLWLLVPPTDDWLPTPCIAHIARCALTARALPAKTRESLIYGYMEFVTRRSDDYWGRAPCLELTRAAATLVRQSAQMPGYLREAVARFCLRAYGLSRAFWDAVEEVDLPPLLAEARRAFDRVVAGGGDIAPALAWLQAQGNADAPRLRRDLTAPQDAPQDALRAMAHPRTPAVPDDTARLVRENLPVLDPTVPSAHHAALQHDCARRIEAALVAPQAADASALLDRLDMVADARTQHLGLGLGLSLLAGIGSQGGATALREAVTHWLRQHLGALAAPERAAPALPVRQAAQRLHRATPVEAASLLEGLVIDPPPPAAPIISAPPLFDVIVVILTCKPYLQTRVPALRDGWLRLLHDLGIPHVFATGDGDGTLHGDILRLDAPDSYEGLPQKTLAAIRWVYEHSDAAHMLKIDDDCFLNAPVFFRSLNYRRFDYYGRRLTLAPGQMDRAWHQPKSTSRAARRTFDKSPEPSTYADGGAGYTLSRHAMRALLDAAARPGGRMLAQHSFMEDKLVGDLLAMAGITVSDEGYHTAIRRRPHRDAIPVSAWQNGFLASRDMPVQMVHLDRAADQSRAMGQLAAPGLWPRKIWPTFQEARLGAHSNALDLITPPESVEAAHEADVAVVSVMRNEMFLLPHFLTHYRALGVGRFIIADNGSDDGTLEYLAAQPDVTLFSVDTDYNRSAYGVAWQQAMLAAFRVGKWSLVADADELLTWQHPQRQSLPSLLATSELKGAEAARLFMLDMYPQGPLEAADFAHGTPFDEAGFADRVPFLRSTPMRGPLSDAPTWTSALRHRLIPGSRPELFVAQKIALMRYHPFMRLSAGLHYVAGARLSPRALFLAHFKYNADFRRKAQAEVARGQHWGDAEEYRKYLALVSEGRSVIYDPGVSVPWFKAPFVADRLG